MFAPIGDGPLRNEQAAGCCAVGHFRTICTGSAAVANRGGQAYGAERDRKCFRISGLSWRCDLDFQSEVDTPSGIWHADVSQIRVDDQMGIIAGGGGRSRLSGMGVEGHLGMVMEQCDEWEQS